MGKIAFIPDIHGPVFSSIFIWQVGHQANVYILLREFIQSLNLSTKL